MCGRYTISLADVQKAEAMFNARLDGSFPPNYNAAPAQALPVITNEDPHRIQFYRWGLIPDWAKEENVGYKMINARVEGIAEKNSFRKPIQKQRCLVLANSFYEWRNQNKVKTPFRIHPTDQPLFAFAGIWNRWINKETGEEIPTFAIITMEANAFMHQLHDRMPAILSAEEAQQWIDKRTSFEEAMQLLKPYAPEKMEAFEVSKDVNKAGNNFPEILEPVGEVLKGDESGAVGQH
jgi:putative SOS response-associated peptidase YedK